MTTWKMLIKNSWMESRFIQFWIVADTFLLGQVLRSRYHDASTCRHRYVIFVFLALVLYAAPVYGRNSPTYTLSVLDGKGHYLSVYLSLDWPKGKEYLDVKMAYWTTGSNLIQDVSRHVIDLSAKYKSLDLQVVKVDKNTWRIYSSKQQNVIINYRVYASEPSPRTSFVDEVGAMIKGASVFLYPSGPEFREYLVIINQPSGWKGPTSSLPWVGGRSPVFRAENLYALLNSYFMLGQYSISSDPTFAYAIAETPVIQFSASVTSGDESLKTAQIPVILSSPSVLDVFVDYRVSGGTSEGKGMDYILEDGTLSISKGDTSANIEFPVIDDVAVEGEETILICLLNPTNALLGSNITHTHIIRDDDTLPQTVAQVVSDLPASVASSARLPTIAILDFQGIGVSAQEARVLTNRLGTHLVQSSHYQVIERGQLEQILQEQDFQLTGCTSDECAIEIGQLIGAQQMLAGSFGKLGIVYTIDMRIIDVETGRILKSTSYDIDGSINRLLSEGLDEAIKRITGID